MISLFIWNSKARAGSVYQELGVGVVQFQGASDFYGTGAPNSSGIGMNGNLGIAWNLMNDNDLFQTHLGFTAQLNHASAENTQFTLLTGYSFIRFEFVRFYFSGGYSPFLVWSKNSSGFSLASLQKSIDSQGFMANGGLIWRVVPEFSLAAQAQVEAIQSSSGLSPNPIYSITLQMRIYFGSIVGKSRRGKFDGWRYPFGIEIH